MCITNPINHHSEWFVQIAELGFNCIRLPFALDTFYLDPVVRPERLSANPGIVPDKSVKKKDKRR